MSNPWLTTPEPPAEFASDEPIAAQRWVPRVAGPQRGVDAPDITDRLPRRYDPRQATLWWVGAHGGAGESTLEALTPGTRAADHTWPIPVAPGVIHRVVLVARADFAGIAAARKASIDWASNSLGGGVRLHGVALMADAPGRRPKPLRDFQRLLAGGVPHLWSLPWLEALRFGPLTPEQRLPTEFRNLFTHLGLAHPASTVHNS
jgi:hypothetical protein